MSRAIVRTDEILGGRWRLDGTTVPIALIRTDETRFGPKDTLRQYRFMHLTAAELDEVLAFDFPGVRPETLTVNCAAVTMHCVCGEDTPQTSVGTESVEVDCVCGRTWRVTANHRLANGADPRPPLT